METARVGIGALVAQNIDEDPVAAFLVQAVDRLIKDLIVVHCLRLFITARRFTGDASCHACFTCRQLPTRRKVS
jgi:hypothetical protein